MSFDLNIVHSELSKLSNSIESVVLIHKNGDSAHLERVYLISSENSIEPSKLDHLYYSLSKTRDETNSPDNLFCSSLCVWTKTAKLAFTLQADINEKSIRTKIGGVPEELKELMQHADLFLRDVFSVVRIDLDSKKSRPALITYIQDKNPSFELKRHTAFCVNGVELFKDRGLSLSASIIKELKAIDIDVANINDSDGVFICIFESNDNSQVKIPQEQEKELARELGLDRDVGLETELVSELRLDKDLDLETELGLESELGVDTEVSNQKNIQCLLETFIEDNGMTVDRCYLDSFEMFEFNDDNGRLEVLININHPFYKKLYSEMGPQSQSAIDFLIASLCHLTHLSLHERTKESNKKFFSDWGHYLENILDGI